MAISFFILLSSTKSYTLTFSAHIMSLSNSSAVTVATAAKNSSRELSVLSEEHRNDALTAIHSALSDAKEDILAANARDLVTANRAAEDGELSQSLLKRLDLSRKGKWEDMLKGIIDVRQLEDPGTWGIRALSIRRWNLLMQYVGSW